MGIRDAFEIGAFGDEDGFDPKRAENDAKTLLSTIQGRRLMHFFLTNMHIGYRGQADAYIQGHRSAGLMMLDTLNELAPDEVRVMIAENGDLLTKRI